MAKSLTDSSLPFGESFRQITRENPTKYRKLSDSSVLRGYYTWWGVSTHWWYLNTVSGCHLKGIIEAISEPYEYIGDHKNSPSFVVPRFLANPTESVYGDKAFTIKFSELLKSYKSSRSDKPLSSVYLKLGGTLRYRYEICYVVIVCMEDEMKRPKINVIGQSVFDLNGLVDDNGKVVFNQLDKSVPDFKARHIIRKRTGPRDPDEQTQERDYSMECSDSSCTDSSCTDGVSDDSTSIVDYSQSTLSSESHEYVNSSSSSERTDANTKSVPDFKARHIIRKRTGPRDPDEQTQERDYSMECSDSSCTDSSCTDGVSDDSTSIVDYSQSTLSSESHEYVNSSSSSERTDANTSYDSECCDRQADSVKHDMFSWEQLVFALYFPNDSMSLRCSKTSITFQDVAHIPQTCRSKVPLVYGNGRVCPYEL